MFDKAIQFLKDHKEIALATCEGNLPKLRIFQIMNKKGMCSTLPLLHRRRSIGSYARIPMLRYWHTQIIYPSDAQAW